MAPGERVYATTVEFSSVLGMPQPGAFYSVKDQPLPPPATYRSREGCCTRCFWFFACLFSIFTIIAVAAGFAALVFFFIVQPSPPKFDIDNLYVSGLNFSSSGSSNSVVNTETTFQLMVRNPNKNIDIFYDDINVQVQTLGLTIADGTLPSFSQSPKTTTYVDGDVELQGVIVNPSTQTALTTAQSEGKVPLSVTVYVDTRLKIGYWAPTGSSGKYKLKVQCDVDVDLRDSTGSQIVDKHCKVKN